MPRFVMGVQCPTPNRIQKVTVTADTRKEAVNKTRQTTTFKRLKRARGGRATAIVIVDEFKGKAKKKKKTKKRAKRKTKKRAKRKTKKRAKRRNRKGQFKKRR